MEETKKLEYIQLGETLVFDKPTFLEMLAKSMSDEEIIIFTRATKDILGATKKKNGEWKHCKIVSFQFQPRVFKEPNTVSDIFRSNPISMIIGKKDILSEEVIKELEKQQPKPTDSIPPSAKAEGILE